MFHTKEIEKFWQEAQNTVPAKYKAAAECILYDLDANGACSSVHTPPKISNPLQVVTLTAHTLAVARSVQKLEREGTILFACSLIAALGHDIGKVPGRLRRTYYAKHLHARKGAELIQEMLRDVLPERALTLIIEAVYHHHDAESKSTVIDILKTSDQQARNEEMMALGMQTIAGEFTTPGENGTKAVAYIPGKRLRAPDPHAEHIAWFDPYVFLMNLKPKINAPYAGWLPHAFSTRDEIVYATPGIIFQVLKEIAKGEKTGELFKFELIEEDGERKKDLVAFVCQQLRESGMLADHLLPGPGYYYRDFVITYQKDIKSQHGLYIPIIGRCMGDMVELEHRKAGRMLGNIKAVRPNHGHWGSTLCVR